MAATKECGYCIPKLDLTMLEVILHDNPNKSPPDRNTLVWEVCISDVKCMNSEAEWGRPPGGLSFPDFKGGVKTRGGPGSSLAGETYGYLNLRIPGAPLDFYPDFGAAAVSFFPTGQLEGGTCTITGDGRRPDGALSDGRGELICCKAFGENHPLRRGSGSGGLHQPGGTFKDCCDYAKAKICQCGSTGKSRAPGRRGSLVPTCCFRGTKDMPLVDDQGIALWNENPAYRPPGDRGPFSPDTGGGMPSPSWLNDVAQYLNQNKNIIKNALLREICKELNTVLELCNVSGEMYPPSIPQPTGIEPVVVGKEEREPFDLNCRCTGSTTTSIEDKKCSSLGYWLT